MRYVPFDPAALEEPLLSQFREWTSRAEKATRAALQDWVDNKEIKFDEKIWKELRDWLIANVFDGRCAYCEVDFDRSRHKPHAEHYRPKAKVTKLGSGSAAPSATALVDGMPVEHPGYFWLAYSWRNILPSCARCNTEGGKLNQFPVANRHFYLEKVSDGSLRGECPIFHDPTTGATLFGPLELDRLEQPLLLNPYVSEPSEHLEFDNFGNISPKCSTDGVPSEIGRNSIKVFRLDDNEITRARQKEQRDGWARWLHNYAYYNSKINVQPAEAWDTSWKEFRRERLAFGVAVECFILRANPRPR